MRKLFLTLALGILSLPALATPITGKLAIAGLNTFTSHSIDFDNPGVVLKATGSLAIMLAHPSVDLNNIPNFASEDGKQLFEWNHGLNISMTIDTFNVTENNANFLNALGTATLSRTGFSPTLYDFSLTSTRPDGITSFTLDAVPLASPVPEPASLAMLGSGMCILAIYGRKMCS